MSMMAEIAERMSDREHVLTDLERAKTLDGPAWLRQIREAGAARFSDTPWPTYKDEAWRFTDIKPIIKTPFTALFGEPANSVSPEQAAIHLYDEASMAQYVFVDGFYSPELSRPAKLPKGVRAGSLAEAIRNDDGVVKKHLDQFVDHSSAFIALNSVFLQDGAFLYIPDNTVLETPIHFVFLSSGTDKTAAHPRNLIVAGNSSRATLLETCAGFENDAVTFGNGVTEIVLGDNARFDRHKVVHEGDGAYHLSTAKVRLGRDSWFESFNVSLTGQITRNELNVVLDGEGAECALNGLYLNDRDRLIDNYLFVEHAKPHCRSRMGYKGILDGTSNAVFTGNVLVPRAAQKTDSNQLNNNLLLSDKATIDTKPQLEIFADDVKCTHGATIGGFPKELLFYFQSRGMSAAMAHGILTYGFADEIVDEIKVGPLHDRLDRYIFDKYSP